MNNINQIVFEIFRDVRDMDYTKNEKKSFKARLKKLYRYFVSGYIWSLKDVHIAMNKYNKFIPTDDIFDDVRLAVYTVSTGKYDIVKEPIYKDERIDYYVITESELPSESIWKKIEIPESIRKWSPLAQARYLKTHPHELFPNHKYSMFIDGNVRITCDVMPLLYTMIAEEKFIAIHRHQVRDCLYDEAKAIYAAGKATWHALRNQTNAYKLDGFPRHFGLYETNIVIREHNKQECIKVMNIWWKQLSDYTLRDQMSFTYALWKNGLSADDVLSLGCNSRLNPYFIVSSHR